MYAHPVVAAAIVWAVAILLAVAGYAFYWGLR